MLSDNEEIKEKIITTNREFQTNKNVLNSKRKDLKMLKITERKILRTQDQQRLQKLSIEIQFGNVWGAKVEVLIKLPMNWEITTRRKGRPRSK